MKKVFWYFWGANYREKGSVKLKIHYNGKVYIVNEVICLGDCWSKARKKNPVLVMQCKADRVEFTITKGYQNCLKYKTAIIYAREDHRRKLVGAHR